MKAAAPLLGTLLASALVAGCNDSCFVRGSRVLTPEGWRAIESLRVGDEVVSLDPKDGQRYVRRIRQVLQRSVPRVVRIQAGEITLAGVSPEHPFWDAAAREFRPVASLSLESRLLVLLPGAREPRELAVEAVALVDGPPKVDVWNLEVDGEEHTYFVEGILVHNKECGPEGEGCEGSGGAGTTQSSSTETTTSTNTGSSSSGGECPSDIECTCPGGLFTTNECGGARCNCPALCSADGDCGEGELCFFYGGTCGESGGNCAAPDRFSELDCTDLPETCGCDGNVYDNWCEAASSGVSYSFAPTSNCAAERVACSDAPGSAECYVETQFCESFGEYPPQCRNLDSNSGAACEDLTCTCISPIYSPENCTCTVNEAGFVDVHCG